MNARVWACAAYGAELDEIMGRPMCFVQEVQSPCTSSRQCSSRMLIQRRRLWARLVELADQGDDVAVQLLHEFSGPHELLTSRAVGLAKVWSDFVDEAPSADDVPPSGRD